MTLTLVPPVQNAPRRARTVPAPRSVPKRTYEPFTLPHFRAWASDLILDTGQSWHPESHQEWFAEDLFSGCPECWAIWPEGNTKTTTLAGLGLYHAEFRPFASVPVAASSREQAEIMYRQMEGFVLRSERLYAEVHSPIQAAKGKRKTDVPRFTCLEGYRRINHYQGGRIQCFAADDRTGDGIIPTLGLMDELHRHRTLAMYRTWAGKIQKRGGQIAGISTRGEPGTDFEETLQRIRDEADEVEQRGAFLRAASPRMILHEWALPEGADPEDMVAVKAANPFSGITLEMLAEKRKSPTMTMHHWLRFVCNRPTRDSDVWLGEDGDKTWTDLEQPFELVDGAPTWIGLDLAIKRDTSAAVVMQRRTDTPDGQPMRYHAKARLWFPKDDKPIDLTDVMQYLREQAGRFDVQAISFDPRFFDVPAKMLTDEGYPMFEVPQSVERMTPAVGSLYEGLTRGLITHDEDQPFTNQVLNAVPRFNDRGFTLEKGKSRGKIDAAIALALAYDQALRHEPEAPSKYEEQGMVAFE